MNTYTYITESRVLKFYNMKYMLKVDQYFISIFSKWHCFSKENTNLLFL